MNTFIQCQLAEALFEFGVANYQNVFDVLGPNFDAIDYKVSINYDKFNGDYYYPLL